MKVMFVAPIAGFGAGDAGYGTASSGIAQVLNVMKEEGSIEELAFVSTSQYNPASVPDHDMDIAIIVTNPHTFKHEQTGKILLDITKRCKKRYLCVLWETFPLPRAWMPLWNWPMLDGFLAPCYFIGTQLARLTIKPVYYYPQYVDTELLPKIDVEQKIKENIFTVLYVGQHTKRKGLEDAVASFMRAFGAVPDARMIVKSHVISDREPPLEQTIFHAAICNTIATKTPIYLTTDTLSRQEMGRLFASASLLHFPSRGEGFGLPPAEAMAIGIPVIYTDWSSTAEVAGAPGNIPLPYFLDEAHSMLHHGYEVASYYSIPLMSSMIEALRGKYMMWKQDRRAYYTEVAGNREIINQRFGTTPVKNCLEHIITGGTGFAYPGSFDQGLWDKLTAEWDQIEAGQKK